LLGVSLKKIQKGVSKQAMKTKQSKNKTTTTKQVSIPDFYQIFFI